MYKESPIAKLIDYIQALPESEQRIIVEKIGTKSKERKTKSAKSSEDQMVRFVKYTSTLPSRLPKSYKFDREEANAR